MVRSKMVLRGIRKPPVLSKERIRRMQRKIGISQTANTTVLENAPEKLELLGKDISVLYQYRYCDQQEFGVILCGRRDIETEKLTEHVAELKGEYLTSLPSMLKVKQACQSAVIGSNVYNVTDDQNFDSDPSIEALSNNNWKLLMSSPHHKKDFTLCSFMKRLFFISGVKLKAGKPKYYRRVRTSVYLDDCLCFDPKTNEWTIKASMKRIRIKAASTVFRGKIVVTGGMSFFYRKGMVF